MKHQQPELGESFKTAFIAPFASYTWASGRGRSHWVELEGWQDAMAGPLSAVIQSGGCEYAYGRDDCYFTGVSDPGTLKARLLEWHAGLVAGVEEFVANDQAEAKDLAFMRSIAAQMKKVVERACEIERVRWSSST
jgi:hypothetical protein